MLPEVAMSNTTFIIKRVPFAKSSFKSYMPQVILIQHCIDNVYITVHKYYESLRYGQQVKHKKKKLNA